MPPRKGPPDGSGTTGAEGKTAIRVPRASSATSQRYLTWSGPATSMSVLGTRKQKHSILPVNRRKAPTVSARGSGLSQSPTGRLPEARAMSAKQRSPTGRAVPALGGSLPQVHKGPPLSVSSQKGRVAPDVGFSSARSEAGSASQAVQIQVGLNLGERDASGSAAAYNFNVSVTATTATTTATAPSHGVGLVSGAGDGESECEDDGRQDHPDSVSHAVPVGGRRKGSGLAGLSSSLPSSTGASANTAAGSTASRTHKQAAWADTTGIESPKLKGAEGRHSPHALTLAPATVTTGHSNGPLRSLSTSNLLGNTGAGTGPGSPSPNTSTTSVSFHVTPGVVSHGHGHSHLSQSTPPPRGRPTILASIVHTSSSRVARVNTDVSPPTSPGLSSPVKLIGTLPTAVSVSVSSGGVLSLPELREGVRAAERAQEEHMHYEHAGTVTGTGPLPPFSPTSPTHRVSRSQGHLQLLAHSHPNFPPSRDKHSPLPVYASTDHAFSLLPLSSGSGGTGTTAGTVAGTGAGASATVTDFGLQDEALEEVEARIHMQRQELVSFGILDPASSSPVPMMPMTRGQSSSLSHPHSHSHSGRPPLHGHGSHSTGPGSRGYSPANTSLGSPEAGNSRSGSGRTTPDPGLMGALSPLTPLPPALDSASPSLSPLDGKTRSPPRLPVFPTHSQSPSPLPLQLSSLASLTISPSPSHADKEREREFAGAKSPGMSELGELRPAARRHLNQPVADILGRLQPLPVTLPAAAPVTVAAPVATYPLGFPAIGSGKEKGSRNNGREKIERDGRKDRDREREREDGHRRRYRDAAVAPAPISVPAQQPPPLIPPLNLKRAHSLNGSPSSSVPLLNLAAVAIRAAANPEARVESPRSNINSPRTEISSGGKSAFSPRSQRSDGSHSARSTSSLLNSSRDLSDLSARSVSASFASSSSSSLSGSGSFSRPTSSSSTSLFESGTHAVYLSSPSSTPPHSSRINLMSISSPRSLGPGPSSFRSPLTSLSPNTSLSAGPSPSPSSSASPFSATATATVSPSIVTPGGPSAGTTLTVALPSSPIGGRSAIPLSPAARPPHSLPPIASPAKQAA